jgi:hypothetical protein
MTERDEIVVVDVGLAVDDDTVLVERGLAFLGDLGIDERRTGQAGDLDADLGLEGVTVTLTGSVLCITR